MHRCPVSAFPSCTIPPFRHYLGARNLMASPTRLQKSQPWSTFPKDINQISSQLQDARVNNYQIQPISHALQDLDQDQGYRIAASLRALREETANETVAGRKIGFTNRNIWPEYNIDRSNWSYMYNTTIIDLTYENSHERLSYDSGIAEVDISHLSNLQPKIEPEIVLGLTRPVSSSMTDAELLGSLDWIAHGFEVVASVFPDWKFTAADTTAAFALHALLLVGPKIYVQEAAERSSERLLQQLTDFKIELRQNGKTVDEGIGSNVLGNPVKALRHLVELLEKDDYNSALEVGEAVTTGTLTRALDIHDGDAWSTKISGIELHGLEVRFKFR